MNYIILCYGIPDEEKDSGLIKEIMERVAKYGKKAFFISGRKGDDFIHNILQKSKEESGSKINIIKIEKDKDKKETGRPAVNDVDRIIMFQTRKSREKNPKNDIEPEGKGSVYIPKEYHELYGLVKVDG